MVAQSRKHSCTVQGKEVQLLIWMTPEAFNTCQRSTIYSRASCEHIPVPNTVSTETIISVQTARILETLLGPVLFVNVERWRNQEDPSAPISCYSAYTAKRMYVQRNYEVSPPDAVGMK
jgi:hypothetical protein